MGVSRSNGAFVRPLSTSLVVDRVALWPSRFPSPRLKKPPDDAPLMTFIRTRRARSGSGTELNSALPFKLHPGDMPT
jgi:hypothetical protein